MQQSFSYDFDSNRTFRDLTEDPEPQLTAWLNGPAGKKLALELSPGGPLPPCLRTHLHVGRECLGSAKTCHRGC